MPTATGSQVLKQALPEIAARMVGLRGDGATRVVEADLKRAVREGATLPARAEGFWIEPSERAAQTPEWHALGASTW
jgi:hypothetical protein